MAAELPPRVLEELRRVRPPGPVPGPEFDALEATPEQLDRYRLPPRPDSRLTPRIYRAWAELVGGRPEIFPAGLPTLQLGVLPTLKGMPGTAGSLGRGTGGFRTRWGTSQNWSGAVIAARDGKLFHSVTGAWRVPEARLPPGLDPAIIANPPGGGFQCSVWIGLDGYRFASRSLPQVGTVSRVKPDGTAEYYLWVQWWVRGKFYGEAKIEKFPVSPGHRIRAELTVLTPTDVRFSVRNLDAGPSGTLITSDWSSGMYTGDVEGRFAPPNDPLVRGETPVEGRHAIWCVERPSVMPPDDQIKAGTVKPEDAEQFVIPDFGESIFSDAMAEMRDLARSPASAEERDLTAARHIRMFEPVPGSPDRVRRLTSPIAPARGGRRMEVRFL